MKYLQAHLIEHLIKHLIKHYIKQSFWLNVGLDNVRLGNV